jgi:C-terminal processing protease CtpA/Prc
MTTKVNVLTVLLLCVLAVTLFPIAGSTNGVMAAEAQGEPGSLTQPSDEANLSNGVIGVSVRIGAERIGDPASLYVAHVHPEGPAQRAGLTPGDEIVMVNAAAVEGKTYEQVIRMVRGVAGTEVKLSVKGKESGREIAITRVDVETLYKKGKMGSHDRGSR